MSDETILEAVDEAAQEKKPTEEQAVVAGAPATAAAGDPTVVDAQANATQVDGTEVIEQLQAELSAAQAKVDELTDKLQRNAAEYQNSRRRQERQLNEAIERASSHLLRRVLPIIDDLELAFANVPASLQNGAEAGESDARNNGQQAWIDGFRQIRKKLVALLEDEGVTAIPATGPFDPTLHEAIASEAHESVPSGYIIETLRTGYEFKGRVLRPALVRVAV